MDAWKALLDVPIEKLVAHTPEGIAVQPLYVAGPAPALRPGTGTFGVCMRSDAAHVAEDLDGGADAVWVDTMDVEAMRIATRRGAHVVTEWNWTAKPTGSDGPTADPDADEPAAMHLWNGLDPLAGAMGGAIEPRIVDAKFLRVLVPIADTLANPLARSVRVSSLPHHEAGADAADELALMMSTMVAYLRALTSDARFDNERAAAQLWFQIAVGRDTFGELCKLRALRVMCAKVFAAAGIAAAPPPVHAVCSTRTQARRDPWVNMLRVSTEVFAAALAGADLVTPLPFDGSAHARRVARNTALVLREESHLGRVIDPAGGAYYIETRTDELARLAWARFTQLERDGGIVRAIASGSLRARLDAAWATRAAAIAKRKEPVLGVSEFANPGEPATPAQPIAGHRDAEAFEALRDRVTPRSVVLVTLGPPSEHRARAGFASALFAVAGLAAREVPAGVELGPAPDVACICGSDADYVAHAVELASELHTLGARKIVLAGKPGVLERELRAAGVHAFIFAGGDALAMLGEILA